MEAEGRLIGGPEAEPPGISPILYYFGEFHTCAAPVPSPICGTHPVAGKGKFISCLLYTSDAADE